MDRITSGALNRKGGAAHAVGGAADVIGEAAHDPHGHVRLQIGGAGKAKDTPKQPAVTSPVTFDPHWNCNPEDTK